LEAQLYQSRLTSTLKVVRYAVATVLVMPDAVALQLPIPGVEIEVHVRWVPSNGTAPLTTEVIAGAEVSTLVEPPLMDPPAALILDQLPVWSEYV
jgi:hypothetical protein